VIVILKKEERKKNHDFRTDATMFSSRSHPLNTNKKQKNSIKNVDDVN